MIMVFGSMMLLSCDPKVIDDDIPQNDNMITAPNNNMITDSICEIRQINSKIDMFSDFVEMLTDFDADTLTNDQKDALRNVVIRFEDYGENILTEEIKKYE